MLLDPRLHAYRPDLADARLKEQVRSARYAEGRPFTVAAPIADVRKAPHPTAGVMTQALMGEAVAVFDVSAGWAWCQLAGDGYVGYVPLETLAEGVIEATHQVSVPLSFLYPAADLKSSPRGPVYLNSLLTVADEDETWARLADGRFVFRRHVRPRGAGGAEPSGVAAMFEHVPYLWGGKTQQGLDCSGLIQIAFHAAGRPCPRDSDMIERDIGDPLPLEPSLLERGDLVFWKGHVGMMLDRERIIHANGHHMLTVIEPVEEALARIAALYGPATSFRRPFAAIERASAAQMGRTRSAT